MKMKMKTYQVAELESGSFAVINIETLESAFDGVTYSYASEAQEVADSLNQGI